MARKIASDDSRPSADGRDDLNILHPERIIRVAGREVTVREYGFMQGLRIAAAAAPIIAELADAAERSLDVELVLATLAAHPAELVALIAAATDLTPAQIEALPDDEGQLLLLTWWAVNAPFFVRRVVMRVAPRLAAAPSAGATSSPSSSPSATTPSDSSSIPAGS
ncbi:MAG: hypothetical protein JSR92_19940 [Proteobacteria bacterium]|nr:hypothetical protein [Pseudomonadota bacterium]